MMQKLCEGGTHLKEGVRVGHLGDVAQWNGVRLPGLRGVVPGPPRAVGDHHTRVRLGGWVHRPAAEKVEEPLMDCMDLKSNYQLNNSVNRWSWEIHMCLFLLWSWKIMRDDICVFLD